MKKYQISVRTRLLIDDKVIYGQGISQLLQQIDTLKSIRLAAKEMGMTYRKALSIIKIAEEGLHQQLLIKKIGGIDGGGSYLTDFGKEFMNQFKNFENDILGYSNDKFKEYFKGFIQ